MAMLYMVCCITLYLSVPESLAELFAPDVQSGVDFADVSALAVKLLMIMSLFGVSDATTQVFCGAFRGSGDTLAMMIICSSCAIAKAVTALILVEAGFSAITIWMVEVTTCAVEAVLVTLRFRSGAWRKIKLIR